MVVGDRHAFLITAYCQPDLLRTLVRLLDHPDTDIFVHLDAATMPTVGLPTVHSRRFVARSSVHWGGESITRATLGLLRAAVSLDDYAYIHMISGTDLPLVPFPTIQDRLAGRTEQFLKQCPHLDEHARWKVAYWHPFVETHHYRTSTPLKVISHGAVLAQRNLGLDRMRRLGIEPRHTSPWWSITQDFANWLLSKEDWIRSVFIRGLAAEEVFTLTAYDTFKPDFALSSRQEGDLRLLNAEPGEVRSPRDFTMADLQTLRAAAPQVLFARKFDIERQPAIVNHIAGRILGGNPI